MATTPDAKAPPVGKITPPGKPAVGALQSEAGKWKMLVVQDGALAPAPAASPTPKANGRQQHALLHLPHPRHGESALFMLAGGALLEMRRARRSEYACWFVDDRCESQGDMLFATRMDPLFLALPALEKARNKTPEHPGRFCSREQIFAGWAEACDAAISLSKLEAMSLEVVCDVQEVAEDLYFRLSDNKVVSWLTSKVSALLAFKYPGVDLAAWRKASEGSSSDSHAALSRDEQIKAIQDADRARGDKDRIVWAAGMVVDYTHKTWAQTLLAALNLSLTDIDAATQKKEKAKGSENPSAGGAASSSAASAASSRPREGESDAGNANKKAKVAAGGKVLTKAEQFAKKGLSTKGMSSMASFFKPKPK